MLPLWVRGGRPISVPLSRNRHLTIPLIPALFSTLFLALYILQPIPLPLLPSTRPASGFIVPKSTFLPPPPDHPLARPDYLPEPIAPKAAASGMVVPDSVHYVYGLKPLPEGRQEGEELPYYAYLAMRSAVIHLKPKKIYFHYLHLPTGPWWDLILPHLTLIKTHVPDSIYGKPINHFAHKADVLRLLAMKHSGGIYLDIDIFVVKPFDDLLYAPTTLAWEASPDSRRAPTDPEGLCNAVIISAPDSRFIDRWLESYATFDESSWAHHSVVVPWQLARAFPDEVQVLNSRAMFWPMWHGEEIQYTHERDDYDFIQTGQYAYHAWESLAMGYLSKLSPERIRNEDNSFNRLVRPFIGPDDDQVYKSWKGRD